MYRIQVLIQQITINVLKHALLIQVTLKYGYFFLITASSSPNDTSVFVSLITSSQFHNIPWSFAFLVVFKQENSQYKFLVFLPTCKIMLSIMLFGISQTSFISYNYIIIFYYSCFLFLNLKKQKNHLTFQSEYSFTG